MRCDCQNNNFKLQIDDNIDIYKQQGELGIGNWYKKYSDLHVILRIGVNCKMLLWLCNLAMWKYIIQDISNALQFLPLAAVAGIVVYFIFRVIFRNNVAEQRNLMARILFMMYLLMLLQITLLTREPGSRTTMNLKFFGTLWNGVRISDLSTNKMD